MCVCVCVHASHTRTNPSAHPCLPLPLLILQAVFIITLGTNRLVVPQLNLPQNLQRMRTVLGMERSFALSSPPEVAGEGAMAALEEEEEEEGGGSEGESRIMNITVSVQVQRGAGDHCSTATVKAAVQGAVQKALHQLPSGGDRNTSTSATATASISESEQKKPRSRSRGRR